MMAAMAIIEIDAGMPAPAIQFPSILLINPKFSANVTTIYRLGACFGVPQIWHTGRRIGPEMGRGRRTRLPPEERMRGYEKVDLIGCEDALSRFVAADARIVGVELAAGSQSLIDFEHLPDGEAETGVVYVFGPEDGRLTPAQLECCCVVVQIPSFHCLNLASAVAAVLWDRTSELSRVHGIAAPTPATP